MFSSIHFLFLSSLGVFSWAILCYFTQIEKYHLMHSANSEGQSNGNCLNYFNLSLYQYILKNIYLRFSTIFWTSNRSDAIKPG